jgi:putative ABC transport system permease protein
MEDRAAESVAMRRESAMLLAVFSFIALVLATVGIYGVVSYSVARRTKEIGVRLVLGARRGEVTAGVMREGMMIALSGVAGGIIAAMALTRLLRSLLYGVGVWDPVTFVVVPLVLISVALVACYIPARRAARISPMVALRWE